MIPLIILAATVVGGTPNYDINQMCQAANLITNDDASVAGCVQDEQAAKDRISKNWSKYPVAAKQACIGTTPKDVGNSYVETETCFEMQEWKNSLDTVGGNHVPGAHGPQIK
jgi:hypothetical protein